MSRRLEDFTVRINLEGWHIPGHGTCWAGQEFQGDTILPRMIQALEQGDKFKFQGRMVDVCVLRGGTLDELKEAFGKGALDIDTSVPAKAPVKVAEPVKAPTPEPEPEPASEPEPEPVETSVDEDDDDEDLKPIKKKASKKRVVRRPRQKR